MADKSVIESEAKKAKSDERLSAAQKKRDEQLEKLRERKEFFENLKQKKEMQ